MDAHDIYNLSEAYQAVHAPREISEEQVWEEVESWVNSLVEEGYDLSDYTWDDLYEYYVSEAKEDEGLSPLQKIRKRNKRQDLVMKPGSQTWERRGYHEGGRGVKKDKDERDNTGKNKWAREAEIKQRYSPGEYEERNAANIRAIKSRRKVGGERGLPEQVDLYDIILSHLLDEGYAESQESAEAIMVNMSEDWKDSILDEAVRGAKKGTIRSVIEKGGKSIKYVQSGGDIVAGDRAAQERASAADRRRRGRNRANAARAEQARKKSIEAMNSDPNESPDRHTITRHYKGRKDSEDLGVEHYHDEVPTDYRARRRRASGR